MQAILSVIGFVLIVAGVAVGLVSFLAPGQVILGLNPGLATTFLGFITSDQSVPIFFAGVTARGRIGFKSRGPLASIHDAYLCRLLGADI